MVAVKKHPLDTNWYCGDCGTKLVGEGEGEACPSCSFRGGFKVTDQRLMNKQEQDAAHAHAQRREASSPDDLRALGWTVAVHNDYMLDSCRMTFWLLTNPLTGTFVKGEGFTDAEALNQCRRELLVKSKLIPEPNRSTMIKLLVDSSPKPLSDPSEYDFNWK